MLKKAFKHFKSPVSVSKIYSVQEELKKKYFYMSDFRYVICILGFFREYMFFFLFLEEAYPTSCLCEPNTITHKCGAYGQSNGI